MNKGLRTVSRVQKTFDTKEKMEREREREKKKRKGGKRQLATVHFVIQFSDCETVFFYLGVF